MTGYRPYIFAIALSVSSVPSLAQRTVPSYVGPLEALDAPAAMAASTPTIGEVQSLNVSVPSVYVPIIPCRLADTRYFESGSTPFGGLGFGAGETLGFWGWDDWAVSYEFFGGNSDGCGIPGTATAIHVNFTVIGPKGRGYLRTWPNNANEPMATLFAWSPGFGVSNAGTIAICSETTESEGSNACQDSYGNIVDFWVKIYSEEAEHIAIDAFGYYTPL
jgi:hypothetical protein